MEIQRDGGRTVANHEDCGSQRVPNHGGHLHAPGSGDDAGHGGGLGRRIQEGGYRGQEGSLAETAGQHAVFPSDRDLRLNSRSFGSGALFVGCNRFIIE